MYLRLGTLAAGCFSLNAVLAWALPVSSNPANALTALAVASVPSVPEVPAPRSCRDDVAWLALEAEMEEVLLLLDDNDYETRLAAESWIEAGLDNEDYALAEFLEYRLRQRLNSGLVSLQQKRSLQTLLGPASLWPYDEPFLAIERLLAARTRSFDSIRAMLEPTFRDAEEAAQKAENRASAEQLSRTSAAAPVGLWGAVNPASLAKTFDAAAVALERAVAWRTVVSAALGKMGGALLTTVTEDPIVRIGDRFFAVSKGPSVDLPIVKITEVGGTDYKPKLLTLSPGEDLTQRNFRRVFASRLKPYGCWQGKPSPFPLGLETYVVEGPTSVYRASTGDWVTPSSRKLEVVAEDSTIGPVAMEKLREPLRFHPQTGYPLENTGPFGRKLEMSYHPDRVVRR